jgi:hypothetical protein
MTALPSVTPPHEGRKSADDREPIVPQPEKGNHPEPEPGNRPAIPREDRPPERKEGVVSYPDFV